MAVSLETIAEKLNLARAYYLQLTNFDYSQAIAGYCAQYTQKLKCLNRLIRALNWDVTEEHNTDTTQRLYAMLLTEISPYSGATLPYDPSVVIPGITILVAQSYVTPQKLYFANDAMPGIADWQATYADDFGNDPTFAVYLPTGNPDEYALFTGVSEVLTFDASGTELLTAYFDFGIAQTGYILIST